MATNNTIHTHAHTHTHKHTHTHTHSAVDGVTAARRASGDGVALYDCEDWAGVRADSDFVPLDHPGTAHPVPHTLTHAHMRTAREPCIRSR